MFSVFTGSSDHTWSPLNLTKSTSEARRSNILYSFTAFTETLIDSFKQKYEAVHLHPQYKYWLPGFVIVNVYMYRLQELV